MAILFGAQLIAQAALRQFNVSIRNWLVFGYISKQSAPFRNTHGQEILLCTDGGILDDAVGHESAHPIQHLANLEVALGDCNHFANWCAERSHCGIAKQGSAADGKACRKRSRVHPPTCNKPTPSACADAPRARSQRLPCEVQPPTRNQPSHRPAVGPTAIVSPSPGRGRTWDHTCPAARL